MSDGLVEGAETERSEQLAYLFRDELEEVDDELRLAVEAFAQLRVLRRNTNRAGVEMADPHHDAARDDERRSGETELLRTEQRSDHHVAAGLQLTIGLYDEAVPKAVEEQRLLRLREPELPRRARVLERS